MNEDFALTKSYCVLSHCPSITETEQNILQSKPRINPIPFTFLLNRILVLMFLFCFFLQNMTYKDRFCVL
jgi:hypothetical protein